MADKPLDIGIVFFPGMTQLDVTGPFEVLARLPNARMHLLWKRVEPITSDVGLTLVPTATFDTCPTLDVLCIGGGPGRNAVMDDAEMLECIARIGATARYVTSVCSGSLILAAAGLLNGYRSTCHWMSRDQLSGDGAWSWLVARPALPGVDQCRRMVTGLASRGMRLSTWMASATSPA